MNQKADNAKPLRCNYFCIRSSSKIVFLACALGIILLLNACATYVPPPPLRIPDLAYLDTGTGQNAYLWTSGLSGKINFGNSHDYATITQINDVNIPARYIPKAVGRPSRSKLLEIPAGKHIVEILYKEVDRTLSFLSLTTLAIEQSRQTLTFIAEPNRTYSPFVTDQCSRDWFWIEDWGPYVAGQKAIHSFIDFIDGNIRWIGSDYTKPVVAGEAPNKNECKKNSNVNKENSNVNKGQQSPP